MSSFHSDEPTVPSQPGYLAPLVLAKLMHFQVNDPVQTPKGAGIFLEQVVVVKQQANSVAADEAAGAADKTAVAAEGVDKGGAGVEAGTLLVHEGPQIEYKVRLIELDHQPIEVFKQGYVVPRLRLLASDEVPPGTKVIVPSLDQALGGLCRGVILLYNSEDGSYKIQIEEEGEDKAMDEKNQEINQEEKARVDLLAATTRRTVLKKDLVYAPGTRVRTPHGNGIIEAYRYEEQMYDVLLHSKEEVSLAYFPKALNFQQLFDKMGGAISMEQARSASALAAYAYDTVEQLCEDNSSSLSLARLSMKDALHFSLSSDPKFMQAVCEVEKSGKEEFTRLVQLALDTQERIGKITRDSEMVRESTELITRSQGILNRIGASEESTEFLRQLKHEINQKMKSEQCQESLSQLLTLVESQLKKEPILKTLSSSSSSSSLACTASLSSSTPSSIAVQSFFQRTMEDYPKMIQELARLSRGNERDVSKALSSDLNAVDILNAAAENYLPTVAEKAANFLSQTELLIQTSTSTSTSTTAPHAQNMLAKAKEYVNAAEQRDLGRTIAQAIGQIDVQEWSRWGENMAASESARQDFASQLKDQCLDFLLSVLPSISVPAITGIKDEVQYEISNLDLSQFKVHKEDVHVRIGASFNEEQVLEMNAMNMRTFIPGFQWKFAQTSFPFFNGGGAADASMTGGRIRLGFKVHRSPMDNQEKAFKPKLALSSIKIDIDDELIITVHGSWFSFAYNMLVGMFAALIKDYIVSTLESYLIDHMTVLMDSLNSFLDMGSGSPLWPVFLDMTELDMQALPEADAWRGATVYEIQTSSNECDVIVQDAAATEGSLGVRFEKCLRSRHAMIGSFFNVHDGADELGEGEIQRAGTVPVGATLVAINGLSVAELTVQEVVGLLEKLERPLLLRFAMASSSSTATAATATATATSTSLTDRGIENGWSTGTKRNGNQPPLNVPGHETPRNIVQAFDIVFGEGSLGLKLRSRPLASTGVMVSGFTRVSDGRMGPAEKAGNITAGQLIICVNKENILHLNFEETLEKLKSTARPMTLTFAHNSDGVVTFREWPPEINLASSEGYVTISGFKRRKSEALRHGVEKGDILVSVNDVFVNNTKEFSYIDVMKTINAAIEAKEPYRLSFKKPALEVEEEEKSLVRQVSFTGGAPGILFAKNKAGATVIKDFVSCTGPGERCRLLYPGLAILQVNQQDVAVAKDALDTCCTKSEQAEETREDRDRFRVEEMIAQATQPPYSLTVRNVALHHALALLHATPQS